MTQQSHCWAYTPRKPELKETRVPQCSSQHCLYLCPCPTPAAVHRSKPWHSVMGRQQILNGVGGHCWPGAGPVGWPALRCPFCSLLNDASRWMSREVLCSGVRWHRQWFSGETDGSQRSNSESNSLGKLIPWMQEKCLGQRCGQESGPPASL